MWSNKYLLSLLSLYKLLRQILRLVFLIHMEALAGLETKVLRSCHHKDKEFMHKI